MRDFKSIVRPNILVLEQLRQELPKEDRYPVRVHLDANENPFNAPFNRYPQAEAKELKEAIGQMKSLWPHCIGLANGTDESVNLLFRTFCNPCEDNVVAIEPTTRRYREFSLLYSVGYRRHLLNSDFQFSAEEVLAKCDEQTKLIFLCSPNDPTGNLLDRHEIELLCKHFNGIVVVDESYQEFSNSTSLVRSISTYNNLVVLSTLSNAFASADLRVSIVCAVPEIIRYLQCIQQPFTISSWAQREALKILRRRFDVDKWTNQLLEERRKVIEAVRLLPCCEAVYPSNANFFMAKFTNGNEVYRYLRRNGIAVFNCSHLSNCKDCLRISIGLANENNALIGALRQMQQKKPD
ncbi:histidinol-phosphate transaminase [gut metagenome]|uniref:Histidinol-phosphate transaminase n=1 Tax=gut metagenome TaxID=749906 RepID=J9GKM9_9ZZZZ